MPKFSSYIFCGDNNEGTTGSVCTLSNMLILFNDPANPDSDGPLEAIFEEAMKIAEQQKSVHWIRTKPCLQTPKLSRRVLKPNHLKNIHLHYGYDALPALIQQFCTKTLFVNAITCSALFVELQETTWFLTKAECAALLALLSNSANWMAAKRSESYEHFPVVVVLKDYAEYHLLASLYTKHVLRWRSSKDWEDMFGRKEKNEIPYRVVELPTSFRKRRVPRKRPRKL